MLGGVKKRTWLVLEYRPGPGYAWRTVSALHDSLEDAYDSLRQLWGPRTEVQMYIPQEVAALYDAFDVEAD